MKNLLLIFVSAFPLVAITQTIKTIAGRNVGNGDPIKAVEIYPQSVAIDQNDNVYVCDQHVVLKLADGRVSLVAGNGLSGYSGDGGPATEALLRDVLGLCFDKKTGELIIADQNGSIIRKVSSSGIIMTIAGTGTEGYSGDDGPATRAKIKCERGICTDYEGNIFITSTAYNVIRKIDTSGIITRIAGGVDYGPLPNDGDLALNARLTFPKGLTVDTLNNLFLTTGTQLWKINTDGILSIVAGNGGGVFSGEGGLAKNTSLGTLNGNPTIDRWGNIYVASPGQYRVYKISPAGYLTTYAGNGSSALVTWEGGNATSSPVIPYTLAIRSTGELFGVSLNKLFQIDTNERIWTYARADYDPIKFEGQNALQIQLRPSTSGFFDANNNLFFSIYGSIVKMNEGGTLSKISGILPGKNGASDTLRDKFNDLKFFGFDSAQSLLYRDNSELKKLSKVGVIEHIAGISAYPVEYNGDAIPAASAELGTEFSATLDSKGNIFISSNYTSQAGGIYQPLSLIRKIDNQGIITTIAGGKSVNNGSGGAGDGGPANNATFTKAGPVCFDDNDNLYIIDDRSIIRMIDNSGLISTKAGNLNAPQLTDSVEATSSLIAASYIRVDRSGDLYLSDPYNHRIRRIDSFGIITTFAGGGISYDENIAAQDALIIPDWFTFDHFGDLVFGESTNNRIRKITFPENKWTGTVNHSWEDAGNWSAGHVPNSDDKVTINSGTITVNSDVTVRNLKLMPGVNVTVTSGHQFNILY